MKTNHVVFTFNDSMTEINYAAEMPFESSVRKHKS